MSDRRLAIHPVQEVDRSRTLTFTVDGKSVTAYEGETIAASLCASGVDTLSRSFKYHRRRGMLCGAGRCANCLMAVDGVPNVRTCLEPARDGAVVHSQHAWPSLEHDVQAGLDWCGPLLPVGFYYKTFMRPRWLWPAYEHVLRHLAGLGRLDPANVKHSEPTEIVYQHCDVLVIGGGPAGIAAALEAARLGADVILADNQPSLGGHLRWHLLSSDGTLADYQRAAKLGALVADQPRIRQMSNATAFGLYEGQLVALLQGDRMTRIRAERLVVATGGFEHPLVFHNNDLPGIFLSEGIQRLLALQRVAPGRRAVVIANDDRGLRVTRELLASGLEIAAVADARVNADSTETRYVRELGVTVLPAHTVLEAHGRKRVERVILTEIDAAGAPIAGRTKSLDADLLVLATGWEPNISLLAQDSIRLAYREELGAFFPATLPPWLFATGQVAGVRNLEAILRHGTQTGLKAAVSLGLGDERDATTAAADLSTDVQPDTIRPLVSVPSSKSKQFVCLCEDVSVKDLNNAIAEGFDDIQTLKRYSTVTMGPCQGKMCHQSSVSICAAVTGSTATSTGTTTARPPAMPVPLGILAGPSRDPVRRSPMHDCHKGVTWTDMGAWKRPLLYTTVEAECRTVRQGVGLIDVSTLGKLDVRGKDAAAFLDWIHPNRVSNLKPGRIRYRLMLDDTGIIVDDGTIARLSEDHFLVTTGTGALDMVQQALEWGLADGTRCAHVTNVTAAFGAINVAGPRSRELLARLTDFDLSSEAVPYLACVEARVAGVEMTLLRIGFVGELSYELHFASQYGEYVWSTLLEAGRDLGIAPFGVEAQRILRLEKLHIIPGHDTDALSNPFEADMAWTVKLEKSDFVGRAALARLASQPLKQRLVGFEMANGVLPDEGDPVVADGMPVGRVTSAKRSPFLGKTIGMAWVPPAMAESGNEFQIRCDGRNVAGRVVLQPFYDPGGERLKS